MSHKLVSCILMAGLVTLVAVGCTIAENDPGSLPAGSPSPTTEEARLDLSEMLQIHSISIQDDDRCGPWSQCPYTAHFDLHRTGDCFAGTAEFTTGGGYGWWLPGAATESITVPIEIVNSFLETLAETPLKKGGRRVVPTWCDSDPFIAIELSSDTWRCRFSSTSPTQDRTPWLVTILVEDDLDRSGGFVIESDIPVRALDLLNPYLRRDVQQKLFKEAGSKPGKR